jgi:hypothetical protein
MGNVGNPSGSKPQDELYVDEEMVPSDGSLKKYKEVPFAEVTADRGVNQMNSTLQGGVKEGFDNGQVIGC